LALGAGLWDLRSRRPLLVGTRKRKAAAEQSRRLFAFPNAPLGATRLEAARGEYPGAASSPTVRGMTINHRTARASSGAAALFMIHVAATAPACAAEQKIALADGADTLIIPANSPVRYQSTGKNDDIHFVGRFILTGEFHYGCASDCDDKQPSFEFVIAPDADLKARLPHWSQRTGDLRISIDASRRLVPAIIPRRRLALVRAGKLDAVSGRVSILVENYTADIECDAPQYSVRFVALVKPVQVATASNSGEFGC